MCLLAFYDPSLPSPGFSTHRQQRDSTVTRAAITQAQQWWSLFSAVQFSAITHFSAVKIACRVVVIHSKIPNYPRIVRDLILVRVFSSSKAPY